MRIKLKSCWNHIAITLLWIWLVIVNIPCTNILLICHKSGAIVWMVFCKAFWEDLGVSPRFRVCSTENGWRCLFTQAVDLSPQPSNGWKLELKISLTMWFFLHITVNLCLNKQTTCHASTPTETLTFWFTYLPNQSGSNRFNCWHAMFFVVSDSNIVWVS